MKYCPKCSKRYPEDYLYFCLDDGETLASFSGDDPPPPPTIIIDPPRTTEPGTKPAPTFGGGAANQNYGQLNAIEQPNFGSPQQQIYYESPPVMPHKLDTGLPTASLILGISSLLLMCCYLGFPLGIGAIVTGIMGYKNIQKNPDLYGGNGLAIGGMILGGISIGFSILYIIFVVVLQLMS